MAFGQFIQGFEVCEAVNWTLTERCCRRKETCRSKLLSSGFFGCDRASWFHNIVQTVKGERCSLQFSQLGRFIYIENLVGNGEVWSQSYFHNRGSSCPRWIHKAIFMPSEPIPSLSNSPNWKSHHHKSSFPRKLVESQQQQQYYRLHFF